MNDAESIEAVCVLLGEANNRSFHLVLVEPREATWVAGVEAAMHRCQVRLVRS